MHCSMRAEPSSRRHAPEMKFATNADDGFRVAYDLVGDGPPLLLFHGSLASCKAWRALGYVDALSVAHQLILIDARGHGHSDRPTTMDAYAMERVVDDVIAVLDACDVPQAAYLGYSLGGRVGFGLAIRAPERVRALILGGASHRPQHGALDRVFYPGFVETIETEGIDSFLQQWSKRLRRPVDPAVRAVIVGNDPRALVAPCDRPIVSRASTTSSSRAFGVPSCCSPASTTTSGSETLGLRRPSFPTPSCSSSPRPITSRLLSAFSRSRRMCERSSNAAARRVDICG